MENMVVLLDANVLLDYLCDREPFRQDAARIFQLCAENAIHGFVAAHSITNIFYILRKRFPSQERKQMLLDICDVLDIVDVDKQKIIKALQNENFDDIEDYLQIECAKSASADYLITRNMDDFTESPLTAILPDDFLKRL
jgi:predicted nucleic acid-binding protein